MTGIVEKALRLWGLSGAQYRLEAKRENQVFRIDHATGTYAMRLHRPGLRTDRELRSELDWMNAVAQGGLAVPHPIPARDGRVVQAIDGVQIDVLTWLSGAPIGGTRTGLQIEDRQKVFRSIGREMARLHDMSDAWPIPQDFDRPAWDVDGLVGETPVWGRFWENPALAPHDRETLIALRVVATDTLGQLADSLDYGLIHADLVRENVILDGDRVQFIDFDDCGFGYRLFDVATALFKNFHEPDFEHLKAALFEGYRSHRRLDTRAFELFMALRSATYVGWNIARMHEDGAIQRNTRFIQNAVAMAERALSTCPENKASRT